jgi:hypothetical protein
MKPTNVSTLRQDAEELARRAELFDQNAMALIDMASKNAAAGDPTARAFCAEYDRVLAERPKSMTREAAEALTILKDSRTEPRDVLAALTSLPSVGCNDDVLAACVLLGVGTELTDAYIATLCDAAGSYRKAFEAGYELAGDSDRMSEIAQTLPAGAVGFLCAGHCVGMGRRIQAARAGELEPLGADIGWELGKR